MNKCFAGFCTTAIVVATTLASVSSTKADVIIIRGADGEAPESLKGEIEPMAGGKLRIKQADGSVKEIDGADVVSIHDADDDSDMNEIPVIDIGTGATRPVEDPMPDTTPEVKIPDPDDTPEVKVPDPDTTPEVKIPDPDDTPEAGTEHNTPIPDITFTEGRGDSVTGLYPLYKGAKWVRDNGSIRRELEILKVKIDGKKTIYTEQKTKYKNGTPTPSKDEIIVEELNGRTFYWRKFSSKKIILLVEPVKVNAHWPIDDDFEMVVESLTESYKDADGKTHDNCVKIVQRSIATGRVLSGSAKYFAEGKGEVSDSFISYTKPKK